MELQRHWNWLGGHWREAGCEFEVGWRVGSSERWPRSRADDARAAIEACAVAAGRWGARTRRERVAHLRRVAAALEPERVAAALAPDLGLAASELRERLDEELFRFTEALELMSEGPDAPGVGVFCAHWSDLVGGLGARVARHLAAGRCVVARSDPRLPRAAELLARACEVAELPHGVVSILHGDERELDAALTGTPGLAFVRVRELDSRLEELAPRALARVETSWELWRVANASSYVPADADPRAAACDVTERFIGRSSTISAQFPGSVARVLCHERLFSRFSEELLACLESSPDARRPVPPLDADLTEHVAHAWALGLDEGATPIFGVAPGDRGLEVGPAGLVFTNVDPRSGLARLTRPAPVLGLVRVADEAEAAELRRELDGTPLKDLRPFPS